MTRLLLLQTLATAIRQSADASSVVLPSARKPTRSFRLMLASFTEKPRFFFNTITGTLHGSHVIPPLTAAVALGSWLRHTIGTRPRASSRTAGERALDARAFSLPRFCPFPSRAPRYDSSKPFL
eukprot:6196690-Pleurochrysis_carterae.AAC.1